MESKNWTRRDLLKVIGATAGGAVLYQAMTSLGFANESHFKGAPHLTNAPKGAKVLILGSGMAGLVAAHELLKSGYDVELLEFNDRVGGRSWSIRGGDTYTELGGETQHCQFDKGLYLNPGPWRIPYHHHGYLHYAREFGVLMQPFNQFNQNAYLHNSKAFGGKPQRYKHIMTDFKGATNELLAKAINQNALDEALTNENKEQLLEALKTWGALDKDYRYTAASGSPYRGWAEDANAIHDNIPSEPIKLDDILTSNLWQSLSVPFDYEYAPSIFQPVGGMDQLPKAIAKTFPERITFKAKVTKIIQDEKGVTVTYQDLANNNQEKEVKADWCVCTIPFSVLSQIENNLNNKIKDGIADIHYGASFKAGIQFKRRFWEEDEHIYGGITYTDLPIGQMSYPSNDFLSKGKGVVLSSYLFGSEAFKFSSLTPKARLQKVFNDVKAIHPQAATEFDNGFSVAWHKSPFTLGCYGLWTPDKRNQYFKTVTTMDNRIVLAGEHLSYIPAWQEGAILSSLEAIRQLHIAATSTK